MPAMMRLYERRAVCVVTLITEVTEADCCRASPRTSCVVHTEPATGHSTAMSFSESAYYSPTLVLS